VHAQAMQAESRISIRLSKIKEQSTLRPKNIPCLIGAKTNSQYNHKKNVLEQKPIDLI